MRNGRDRVRERQTRPELRTGDETADAVRVWVTNAHKRDAGIRQRRVMHRDVRKRNNDRRATVAVRFNPDRGPQADADRVAFRRVLVNGQQSGRQRAIDNVTVARRIRDGVMDPRERQRRTTGVIHRDDNIRNGQRGRGCIQRGARGQTRGAVRDGFKAFHGKAIQRTNATGDGRNLFIRARGRIRNQPSRRVVMVPRPDALTVARRPRRWLDQCGRACT